MNDVAIKARAWSCTAMSECFMETNPCSPLNDHMRKATYHFFKVYSTYPRFHGACIFIVRASAPVKQSGHA